MAEHEALSFGTLLRQFRNRLRITQEELTFRSGVSVAAIGALERGTRKWPVKETVQLLINALKLEPEEAEKFRAAAARPPSRRKTTQVGLKNNALFVGREREQAWLETQLQQQPCLLISGEPGVGKSRLLSELAIWAQQQGWVTLAGRCQRYGAQEPYTPVIDALAQHLGNQPPAARRQWLHDYSPLAPMMPLVSEPGEGTAAPPPSAPQDQHFLFATIERYLKQVAGHTRVLLLLDDLQWAGADALHVIAHLARARQRVPLAIVGAYRSSEVPPDHQLSGLIRDLVRDGLVKEQELAPLTEMDASKLAESLLHGLPVPRADMPKLIKQVVRRTAGMPLYLVSYATGLQSQAEEAKAAQKDQLAQNDLLLSLEALTKEIPWDIKQNIRDRVRALSPETQELLRLVAVAGEGATTTLLFASAARKEEEVLKALEAACQAGLLNEEAQEYTDTAPDVYTFTHELIREVVEGDLSGARRLLFHRRVADALAQEGQPQGASAGLWGARLAFHYQHARQPEKAVEFLRLAGDHARAVWAHEDAVQHYRELTRLLDNLGYHQAATVAREDLGGELVQLNQFKQALNLWERAAEDHRVTGDHVAHLRVLMAIGHVHATRGTPATGLKQLRPYVAPELAPRGRSKSELAELYGTLAHLAFMAGHYPEAVTDGQCAVEYAEQVDDLGLCARQRLHLGIALLSVGHITEAVIVLQQSAHEAAGAHDLATQVEALLQASVGHQTLGEFSQSGQIQGQMIEVATRLNNLLGIGHSYFVKALQAFYTGDWAAARMISQLAADAFKSLELSIVSAYPPMGLGWISLLEGQAEAAIGYFEQARVIADNSGGIQVTRLIAELRAEYDLLEGRPVDALKQIMPFLEGEIQLQERTRLELTILRAWAELAQNAPDVALVLITEAVQRARERQMRLVLQDGLRVLALCAMQAHDWPVAKEALAEAIALCQAMRNPHAKAKAHFFMGQLYYAQRHYKEAGEEWAAADTICMRLGERFYGEHIKHAMALLKDQDPQD